MINKDENIDFKQRYWYVEVLQYYPSGFLDDVVATCDTLKELKTLRIGSRDYVDEYFWDNEKREYVEILA